MISSESVAKACSEVGEYSDEQMVREFDRFFRAQPAICDFVVESTHDSGQKVQELSLFLSYMMSELNEPTDDGSELNEEEKGEVFFVVKTVIESLKTQSKGRIIEVD